MRQVNGGYSGWFNRRYGRVGHLWQGRYKAILVEDGPYFLECGRYIHLTPNLSRLTRPAERYPWSSYRNFVRAGMPRASWVSTERTLAHFGGSRSRQQQARQQQARQQQAQKRYRAFVEAGRGERLVSPFERAFAGLVLGGEAFVERIRGLAAGRPDTPSGSRCWPTPSPA